MQVRGATRCDTSPDQDGCVSRQPSVAGDRSATPLRSRDSNATHAKCGLQWGSKIICTFPPLFLPLSFLHSYFHFPSFYRFAILRSADWSGLKRVASHCSRLKREEMHGREETTTRQGRRWIAMPQAHSHSLPLPRALIQAARSINAEQTATSGESPRKLDTSVLERVSYPTRRSIKVASWARKQVGRSPQFRGAWPRPGCSGYTAPCLFQDSTSEASGWAGSSGSASSSLPNSVHLQ